MDLHFFVILARHGVRFRMRVTRHLLNPTTLDITIILNEASSLLANGEAGLDRRSYQRISDH